MNRIVTFAALASALAWAPLQAQEARLHLKNLEKLSAQASEVVDVTLDGPLLKMASQLLGDDKDARDLVSGLTGVYVKTFEFDKADGYSKADVEAIRAQLQPPAWHRIVTVQSRKDGDVGVYVLGDLDKGPARGLAVLVAGPKELVVVNLVGTVDVHKLGALEGKLGVPRLHQGEAKERRDERK